MEEAEAELRGNLERGRVGTRETGRGLGFGGPEA